jgi:UDP-2,3-diacylglucosamine pyrophosphatase LpxH
MTAPSHTYVLSDLHLSDAEPVDPKRPLWKRFKQKDLFLDGSFARFLEWIRAEHPAGGVELVLNGDVFDFDSVMTLPPKGQLKTSWLERRRGLGPEAEKSAFKMDIILRDHAALVSALGAFVRAGNHVVFVIGNHDLELHWPRVQKALRAALEISDREQQQVRICEWFYISSGDTLITHGNQYDSYCLCHNPVNPTIKGTGQPRIRQPFGNIAGKLMLNGMGLFNPHVDGSFIKSPSEYVVFFFRYVMRVQPFLLLSWLWTALATLVVSLREGFLPALTDPLTLDDRVDAIAAKANAEPRTVRALSALAVHPAIFNPAKILRELWLDRALLLALILYGVTHQRRTEA